MARDWETGSIIRLSDVENWDSKVGADELQDLINQLKNGEITVGEAQKWAESITLTLAGDVSGNVNIDGSRNVTLTVDIKKATQAEAQAGTSNAKYMTPLRTKEAIEKLTPTPTKVSVGLGNVDNVKQASKTEFDAHVEEKNVHGLKDQAVVLGKDTTVSGNATSIIVVGHNAKSTDQATITIGLNAESDGNNSVSIGTNSHSSSAHSISMGSGAVCESGNSIALGRNATVNSSSDGGIAIGMNAEVSWSSMAIGHYTTATSNFRMAALGRGATALNAGEGVLGGTDASFHTYNWTVPGSFTVNGTKNFEMPHPKPEKSSTHVIRHSAVESPTAGDNLYRFTVTSTKDNDIQTIDLPDYFVHLNKDVQVFVTPQGHFGNGYGVLNRETEQLEITCQFEGAYNVLVIGTRNDNHQSVQAWDIKGVEREIGESWTGETYVFEVNEIMEVEEMKEEFN